MYANVKRILKEKLDSIWWSCPFITYCWAFLFIIGAKQHPLLLGMAFLAYTLGLRHAFDADHIAAIDNTVRKLVQQKKNPVGVGFFFSLGHSSVVFLMAILLAISVQWAQKGITTLARNGRGNWNNCFWMFFTIYWHS